MALQEKPTRKTTWLKDVPAISLGWELAIPIFGGALLGYQVDRWVGSNYIFTLVLILTGLITGYYNLYKHIQLSLLRTKTAKQKRREEELEP